MEAFDLSELETIEKAIELGKLVDKTLEKTKSFNKILEKKITSFEKVFQILSKVTDEIKKWDVNIGNIKDISSEIKEIDQKVVKDLNNKFIQFKDLISKNVNTILDIFSKINVNLKGNTKIDINILQQQAKKIFDEIVKNINTQLENLSKEFIKVAESFKLQPASEVSQLLADVPKELSQSFDEGLKNIFKFYQEELKDINQEVKSVINKDISGNIKQNVSKYLSEFVVGYVDSEKKFIDEITKVKEDRLNEFFKEHNKALEKFIDKLISKGKVKEIKKDYPWTKFPISLLGESDTRIEKAFEAYVTHDSNYLSEAFEEIAKTQGREVALALQKEAQERGNVYHSYVQKSLLKGWRPPTLEKAQLTGIEKYVVDTQNQLIGKIDALLKEGEKHIIAEFKSLSPTQFEKLEKFVKQYNEGTIKTSQDLFYKILKEMPSLEASLNKYYTQLDAYVKLLADELNVPVEEIAEKIEGQLFIVGKVLSTEPLRAIRFPYKFDIDRLQKAITRVPEIINKVGEKLQKEGIEKTSYSLETMSEVVKLQEEEFERLLKELSKESAPTEEKDIERIKQLKNEIKKQEKYIENMKKAYIGAKNYQQEMTKKIANNIMSIYQGLDEIKIKNIIEKGKKTISDQELQNFKNTYAQYYNEIADAMKETVEATKRMYDYYKNNVKGINKFSEDLNKKYKELQGLIEVHGDVVATDELNKTLSEIQKGTAISHTKIEFIESLATRSKIDRLLRKLPENYSAFIETFYDAQKRQVRSMLHIVNKNVENIKNWADRAAYQEYYGSYLSKPIGNIKIEGIEKFVGEEVLKETFKSPADILTLMQRTGRNIIIETNKNLDKINNILNRVLKEKYGKGLLEFEKISKEANYGLADVIQIAEGKEYEPDVRTFSLVTSGIINRFRDFLVDHLFGEEGVLIPTFNETFKEVIKQVNIEQIYNELKKTKSLPLEQIGGKWQPVQPEGFVRRIKKNLLQGLKNQFMSLFYEARNVNKLEEGPQKFIESVLEDFGEHYYGYIAKYLKESGPFSEYALEELNDLIKGFIEKERDMRINHLKKIVSPSIEELMVDIMRNLRADGELLLNEIEKKAGSEIEAMAMKGEFDEAHRELLSEIGQVMIEVMEEKQKNIIGDIEETNKQIELTEKEWEKIIKEAVHRVENQYRGKKYFGKSPFGLGLGVRGGVYDLLNEVYRKSLAIFKVSALGEERYQYVNEEELFKPITKLEKEFDEDLNKWVLPEGFEEKGVDVEKGFSEMIKDVEKENKAIAEALNKFFESIKSYTEIYLERGQKAGWGGLEASMPREELAKKLRDDIETLAKDTIEIIKKEYVKEKKLSSNTVEALQTIEDVGSQLNKINQEFSTSYESLIKEKGASSVEVYNLINNTIKGIESNLGKIVTSFYVRPELHGIFSKDVWDIERRNLNLSELLDRFKKLSETLVDMIPKDFFKEMSEKGLIGEEQGRKYNKVINMLSKEFESLTDPKGIRNFIKSFKNILKSFKDRRASQIRNMSSFISIFHDVLGDIAYNFKELVRGEPHLYQRAEALFNVDVDTAKMPKELEEFSTTFTIFRREWEDFLKGEKEVKGGYKPFKAALKGVNIQEYGKKLKELSSFIAEKFSNIHEKVSKNYEIIEDRLLNDIISIINIFTGQLGSEYENWVKNIGEVRTFKMAGISFEEKIKSNIDLIKSNVKSLLSEGLKFQEAVYQALIKVLGAKEILSLDPSYVKRMVKEVTGIIKTSTKPEFKELLVKNLFNIPETKNIAAYLFESIFRQAYQSGKDAFENFKFVPEYMGKVIGKSTEARRRLLISFIEEFKKFGYQIDEQLEVLLVSYLENILNSFLQELSKAGPEVKSAYLTKTAAKIKEDLISSFSKVGIVGVKPEPTKELLTQQASLNVQGEYITFPGGPTKPTKEKEKIQRISDLITSYQKGMPVEKEIPATIAQQLTLFPVQSTVAPPMKESGSIVKEVEAQKEMNQQLSSFIELVTKKLGLLTNEQRALEGEIPVIKQSTDEMQNFVDSVKRGTDEISKQKSNIGILEEKLKEYVTTFEQAKKEFFVGITPPKELTSPDAIKEILRRYSYFKDWHKFLIKEGEPSSLKDVRKQISMIIKEAQLSSGEIKQLFSFDFSNKDVLERLNVAYAKLIEKGKISNLSEEEKAARLKEIQKQLREIESTYTSISKVARSSNIEISERLKYANTLKDMVNAYKQGYEEMKKLGVEGSELNLKKIEANYKLLEANAEKIAEQTNAFLSGDEKRANALKEQLTIEQQMEEIKEKANKTAEQLKEFYKKYPEYSRENLMYNEKIVNAFGKQIASVNVLIDKTGKVNLNFGGVIKGLYSGHPATVFGEILKRIALWGTGGWLYFGFLRVARNMMKTIEEVEYKIGELRQVMDKTTTDFNQMQESAFEIARKYGRGISEVLDAMVDFSRIGLKQAEVISLTETAVIGANIGFRGTREAMDYLTSIIKQYNMEMERSIEILDKLAEVADRHATTINDIGEAFKQVGAAAYTLGVKIEELIAMIATLEANTRLRGSMVGRALRLIFRGLHTDATIKELENLGISVLDTIGNFRNLTTVLSELANKWNTLTSNQKENLAKQVAQQRYYNFFMVLMNNWSEVMQGVIEAENSQGAALRKNEEIMKTYAKQVEITQQYLKELYVSLGKAGLLDVLKGATMAARALLSVVSAIPTPLKTIIGIFGAIKLAILGANWTLSMYFGKSLQQTIASVVTLGTRLSSIFKGMKATAVGNVLLTPISAGMISGQQASKKMVDTVSNAVATIGGMKILSVIGKGFSKIGAFIKGAFLNLLKGLGTVIGFFTSTLGAIIASALAVVFGGLYLTWKKNKVTLEKINKETFEILEHTKKAILDFKSSIELYNRATSFQISGYGSIIALQQQRKIINDMALKFPELILYWDKYGNAVIASASDVKTLESRVASLIDRYKELNIKTKMMKIGELMELPGKQTTFWGWIGSWTGGVDTSLEGKIQKITSRLERLKVELEKVRMSADIEEEIKLWKKWENYVKELSNLQIEYQRIIKQIEQEIRAMSKLGGKESFPNILEKLYGGKEKYPGIEKLRNYYESVITSLGDFTPLVKKVYAQRMILLSAFENLGNNIQEIFLGSIENIPLGVQENIFKNFKNTFLKGINKYQLGEAADSIYEELKKQFEKTGSTFDVSFLFKMKDYEKVLKQARSISEKESKPIIFTAEIEKQGALLKRHAIIYKDNISLIDETNDRIKEGYKVLKFNNNALEEMRRLFEGVAKVSGAFLDETTFGPLKRSLISITESMRNYLDDLGAVYDAINSLVEISNRWSNIQLNIIKMGEYSYEKQLDAIKRATLAPFKYMRELGDIFKSVNRDINAQNTFNLLYARINIHSKMLKEGLDAYQRIIKGEPGEFDTYFMQALVNRLKEEGISISIKEILPEEAAIDDFKRKLETELGNIKIPEKEMKNLFKEFQMPDELEKVFSITFKKGGQSGLYREPVYTKSTLDLLEKAYGRYMIIKNIINDTNKNYEERIILLKNEKNNVEKIVQLLEEGKKVALDWRNNTKEIRDVYKNTENYFKNLLKEINELNTGYDIAMQNAEKLAKVKIQLKIEDSFIKRTFDAIWQKSKTLAIGIYGGMMDAFKNASVFLNKLMGKETKGFVVLFKDLLLIGKEYSKTMQFLNKEIDYHLKQLGQSTNVMSQMYHISMALQNIGNQELLRTEKSLDILKDIYGLYEKENKKGEFKKFLGELQETDIDNLKRKLIDTFSTFGKVNLPISLETLVNKEDLIDLKRTAGALEDVEGDIDTAFKELRENARKNFLSTKQQSAQLMQSVVQMMQQQVEAVRSSVQDIVQLYQQEVQKVWSIEDLRAKTEKTQKEVKTIIGTAIKSLGNSPEVNNAFRELRKSFERNLVNAFIVSPRKIEEVLRPTLQELNLAKYFSEETPFENFRKRYEDFVKSIFKLNVNLGTSLKDIMQINNEAIAMWNELQQTFKGNIEIQWETKIPNQEEIGKRVNEIFEHIKNKSSENIRKYFQSNIEISPSAKFSQASLLKMYSMGNINLEDLEKINKFLSEHIFKEGKSLPFEEIAKKATKIKESSIKLPELSEKGLSGRFNRMIDFLDDYSKKLEKIKKLEEDIKDITIDDKKKTEIVQEFTKQLIEVTENPENKEKIKSALENTLKKALSGTKISSEEIKKLLSIFDELSENISKEAIQLHIDVNGIKAKIKTVEDFLLFLHRSNLKSVEESITKQIDTFQNGYKNLWIDYIKKGYESIEKVSDYINDTTKNSISKLEEYYISLQNALSLSTKRIESGELKNESLENEKDYKRVLTDTIKKIQEKMLLLKNLENQIKTFSASVKTWEELYKTINLVNAQIIVFGDEFSVLDKTLDNVRNQLDTLLNVALEGGKRKWEELDAQTKKVIMTLSDYYKYLGRLKLEVDTIVEGVKSMSQAWIDWVYNAENNVDPLSALFSRMRRYRYERYMEELVKELQTKLGQIEPFGGLEYTIKTQQEEYLNELLKAFEKFGEEVKAFSESVDKLIEGRALLPSISLQLIPSQEKELLGQSGVYINAPAEGDKYPFLLSGQEVVLNKQQQKILAQKFPGFEEEVKKIVPIYTPGQKKLQTGGIPPSFISNKKDESKSDIGYLVALTTGGKKMVSSSSLNNIIDYAYSSYFYENLLKKFKTSPRILDRTFLDYLSDISDLLREKYYFSDLFWFDIDNFGNLSKGLEAKVVDKTLKTPGSILLDEFYKYISSEEGLNIAKQGDEGLMIRKLKKLSKGNEIINMKEKANRIIQKTTDFFKNENKIREAFIKTYGKDKESLIDELMKEYKEIIKKNPVSVTVAYPEKGVVNDVFAFKIKADKEISQLKKGGIKGVAISIEIGKEDIEIAKKMKDLKNIIIKESKNNMQSIFSFSFRNSEIDEILKNIHQQSGIFTGDTLRTFIGNLDREALKKFKTVEVFDIKNMKKLNKISHEVADIFPKYLANEIIAESGSGRSIVGLTDMGTTLYVASEFKQAELAKIIERATKNAKEKFYKGMSDLKISSKASLPNPNEIGLNKIGSLDLENYFQKIKGKNIDKAIKTALITPSEKEAVISLKQMSKGKTGIVPVDMTSQEYINNILNNMKTIEKKINKSISLTKGLNKGFNKIKEIPKMENTIKGLGSTAMTSLEIAGYILSYILAAYEMNKPEMGISNPFKKEIGTAILGTSSILAFELGAPIAGLFGNPPFLGAVLGMVLSYLTYEIARSLIKKYFADPDIRKGEELKEKINETITSYNGLVDSSQLFDKKMGELFAPISPLSTNTSSINISRFDTASLEALQKSIIDSYKTLQENVIKIPFIYEEYKELEKKYFPRRKQQILEDIEKIDRDINAFRKKQKEIEEFLGGNPLNGGENLYAENLNKGNLLEIKEQERISNITAGEATQMTPLDRMKKNYFDLEKRIKEKLQEKEELLEYTKPYITLNKDIIKEFVATYGDLIKPYIPKYATGGLVKANKDINAIKKLFGATRPDEVPAILHEGEVVVPKHKVGLLPSEVLNGLPNISPQSNTIYRFDSGGNVGSAGNTIQNSQSNGKKETFFDKFLEFLEEAVYLGKRYTDVEKKLIEEKAKEKAGGKEKWESLKSEEKESLMKEAEEEFKEKNPFKRLVDVGKTYLQMGIASLTQKWTENILRMPAPRALDVSSFTGAGLFQKMTVENADLTQGYIKSGGEIGAGLGGMAASALGLPPFIGEMLGGIAGKAIGEALIPEEMRNLVKQFDELRESMLKFEVASLQVTTSLDLSQRMLDFFNSAISDVVNSVKDSLNSFGKGIEGLSVRIVDANNVFSVTSDGLLNFNNSMTNILNNFSAGMNVKPENIKVEEENISGMFGSNIGGGKFSYVKGEIAPNYNSNIVGDSKNVGVEQVINPITVNKLNDGLKNTVVYLNSTNNLFANLDERLDSTSKSLEIFKKVSGKDFSKGIELNLDAIKSVYARQIEIASSSIGILQKRKDLTIQEGKIIEDQMAAYEKARDNVKKRSGWEKVTDWLGLTSHASEKAAQAAEYEAKRLEAAKQYVQNQKELLDIELKIAEKNQEIAKIREDMLNSIDNYIKQINKMRTAVADEREAWEFVAGILKKQNGDIINLGNIFNTNIVSQFGNNIKDALNTWVKNFNKTVTEDFAELEKENKRRQRFKTRFEIGEFNISNRLGRETVEDTKRLVSLLGQTLAFTQEQIAYIAQISPQVAEKVGAMSVEEVFHAVREFTFGEGQKISAIHQKTNDMLIRIVTTGMDEMTFTTEKYMELMATTIKNWADKNKIITSKIEEAIGKYAIKAQYLNMPTFLGNLNIIGNETEAFDTAIEAFHKNSDVFNDVINIFKEGAYGFLDITDDAKKLYGEQIINIRNYINALQRQFTATETVLQTRISEFTGGIYTYRGGTLNAEQITEIINVIRNNTRLDQYQQEAAIQTLINLNDSLLKTENEMKNQQAELVDFSRKSVELLEQIRTQYTKAFGRPEKERQFIEMNLRFLRNLQHAVNPETGSLYFTELGELNRISEAEYAALMEIGEGQFEIARTFQEFDQKYGAKIAGEGPRDISTWTEVRPITNNIEIKLDMDFLDPSQLSADRQRAIALMVKNALIEESWRFSK